MFQFQALLKEAVDDEMDAEQRELDLWMIKPTNITLKIERNYMKFRKKRTRNDILNR